MSKRAITTVSVTKVSASDVVLTQDVLAIEEPLEIRLTYGKGEKRTTKNISVTMRTPGNDADLAAGFLFTEGILKQYADIQSINTYPYDSNVIQVELSEAVLPEIQKLERNFYTTSSCGVCGKSSIDSIRVVNPYNSLENNSIIKSELIYKLPESLRKMQEVFEKTGGLHASALFDLNGNLIDLKEDVGRHNALDKLIGSALEKNKMPLSQHLLLLSGRASFELIQKAVMAGIRIIASVGAPSSLAVELAKEFDVTLIGFLKAERFNIYCGEKRIHNATN